MVNLIVIGYIIRERHNMAANKDMQETLRTCYNELPCCVIILNSRMQCIFHNTRVLQMLQTCIKSIFCLFRVFRGDNAVLEAIHTIQTSNQSLSLDIETLIYSQLGDLLVHIHIKHIHNKHTIIVINNISNIMAHSIMSTNNIDNAIVLRQILEKSNTAYFAIDAEQKIIFYNPKFESLIDRKHVKNINIASIFTIDVANTSMDVKKFPLCYQNFLENNKLYVSVQNKQNSEVYDKLFVTTQALFQVKDVRFFSVAINQFKSQKDNTPLYWYDVFVHAPIGIGIIKNNALIQYNTFFTTMLDAITRTSYISESFQSNLRHWELDDDLLVQTLKTQIEHSLENDECISTRLILDSDVYDVYVIGVNDNDGRISVVYVHLSKESFIIDAQIEQSQKLQLVGQMVSGIAHDFNNLLTAMLASCHIITLQRSANAHDFQEAVNLSQNIHRAVELTQQLLNFVQTNNNNLCVIDIKKLIYDLIKMLQRLIGSQYFIKIIVKQAVKYTIYAAKTQVEQVITNLIVNARDAMPNGGAIKMKLNTFITNTDIVVNTTTITPGHYVVLEVRDNGIGITSEVLPRIFDPFFSTKSKERGVGLGLSTVFNIIKKMNGYIAIYSKPHTGTAIRIYFPYASSEMYNQDLSLHYKGYQTAIKHETAHSILLIEDDENIRNVITKTLQQKGYQVTDTVNGALALQILTKKHTSFDIVVSDVITPELNGIELANKIFEDKPGTRVLLMSGYSQDFINKEFTIPSGVFFIQKPFRMQALLDKIYDIIQSPGVFKTPTTFTDRKNPNRFL